MRRILYAKPSITELEIRYVDDAIRHGWGERCYEYLVRFREEFKRYLGVAHAFPTSSCTGALHMAFAALGVGPGDEVIAPDLTWVASVAPIVYLGASPVLVDVLPDTWCIDPAQIEAAITERTKAILVVHLYGNPVDMEAVMEIAHTHGLPVVEDAAESLGTECSGRKTGAIGDVGVFSFHGTKTMTTGEGGMLVCNDGCLAERLTVLDNHGRDPKVPRMFWCEQVGYKYKMSNLQAALGCAQLERIDELVAAKRRVFDWYRKHCRHIPDLRWNPEPDGTRNGYWMPTVLLGASHRVKRDTVLEELNRRAIDARPFFYPVSAFPMFEARPQNVVAYGLHGRGINLPNYFEMTEDDVEHVSTELGRCLAHEEASA